MFAPPPEVTAEVFARVPDSLRKNPKESHWVRYQHRGVGAGCFLEGPSFDRAGNFYCVDVAHGRVFRVTPEGSFQVVAEYDGEPNGLKIHRDGRIFITDHKNGILLLDPGRGRVTPYLDRPFLERFFGVNDLFFAASGDLYFTDQGQSGLHDPHGRLFRLSAEGRLEVLLRGIPSPNGLVLNKAEDVVLLAVTRANAIWRVPLGVEGAVVGRTGVFIQMSGGGGPDGLALDEAENLAVCHVGMGSVWLFSRLGEPVLRIRSPAGLGTTNAAFGGPDRRTLYITESQTGVILTARVEVPGRVMYSHM